MNKWVIVGFLSVFFTGCVIPPSDASNQIQAFLSSQPLNNIQTIEYVYADSNTDVTLFKLKFGKTNDCESGCFYSSGFGMIHGDKIGWITFDDYDYKKQIPLTDVNTYMKTLKSYNDSIPYFDFDSDDAVLMTPGFREKIKALQEQAYPSYLELLVKDPDTPRSILYEIIQSNLSNLPPYVVVNSALNNPTVQADASLLKLILTLPENKQTNSDDYIRTQAQEYFDKLTA